MRTQLRIVAGSLRGRKLSCTVNANLRPTPQRVREALFSILGNAVPDLPFLDVFAGTGVVGLEALSRDARSVTFVERDFRLIEELLRHLRTFGIEDRVVMERADVYRWIERWQAPPEPVTIFVSPPFADFARRQEDLMSLMARLQHKAAPGSVIVLQAESNAELDELPHRTAWEERRYGRNLLLIWVKELEAQTPPTARTEEAQERPND
jgi:16S rRNA (guanine(966)-N(2))-methyltransferase RsmD